MNGQLRKCGGILGVPAEAPDCRLKENDQYRFASERAENATRRYGVKSVSLLAVKA